MTTRWATIDSPVGRLTLAADDDGLSHILFQNATLGDTGLEESEAVEAPDDPVLRAATEQLDEYFAGTRTEFDLPLAPTGNEFEMEVGKARTTIPYGKTISYGRQAELIGRPGAARAVGAANGRNPLSIVLPCHRVVGADGALTGFGGGLETKQALLELENGTQRLPF
ncbi:MAG: methylated-DNA--[protein]-cysteine S-methyltransferase [Acidimicrobiales bacterium]